MWALPGPVIEPVSPALAGRFLTTAPPGKSAPYILMCKKNQDISSDEKKQDAEYHLGKNGAGGTRHVTIGICRDCHWKDIQETGSVPF